MKQYMTPDVSLFYLACEDVLTSSGGDADVWGDDIFDPIQGKMNLG